MFPISIDLPVVRNLVENHPGGKIKMIDELHLGDQTDDDIDYFHTSGNINLLGATYLK